MATFSSEHGLLPQHSASLAWHRLTHLVGLASITGRIVGAKPVSLLIVGPPGTGKTAMLKRYDDSTPPNTHMLFGANASAWGIQNVLKEQVPKGACAIVAGEFQTWMYRRGSVWEALHGLLLQALDDGVGDVFNGPEKQVYGHARIGLLAAMTEDAYNRSVAELRKTGLLSRMLVVSWARTPEETRDALLRVNAGDHSELQKLSIRLPAGKIAVGVSRRLGERIARYAHAVSPHNALREHARFLALAQAFAYVAGADAVGEEHWHDLVAQYSHFWTKPS